jgi:hypothetical protein
LIYVFICKTPFFTIHSGSTTTLAARTRSGLGMVGTERRQEDAVIEDRPFAREEELVPALKRQRPHVPGAPYNVG